MFEPNTLPIATPMLSCPIAAKIDTQSSGKDVAKATRMKPTVVFPKPVISATLTELVIVQLLALSKKIKDPKRMAALPNSPSSSNNSVLHLFANSF